jgi:lipopolysaccharide export system protein LptA
VRVSADNVVHDEASGKVTYTGNVEVTRGDMRILSDSLVISRGDEGSGDGIITASGNPLRFMNSGDGQTVSGNADTAVYRIRQKQLELRGAPIRFQSVDARGQQLRGSAREADYDMERSRIRMSGAVNFTQTPGGGRKPVTGTSSRADYDINGKQLVLSGDATVQQDGNTVNNDRIVFNMKDAVITAGQKADARQRVETVLELE